MLATHNPELPMVLEMNIFNFAVKVCLSQKHNEKLQLVVYYSCKMMPAKFNYNIYNKELLVIVVACKQWQLYLEGPKYSV